MLLDSAGKLVSWFGLVLTSDMCKSLGGSVKETLIYELELLAAVLSLHLWCKNSDSNIHVRFGDNDSVRYALIRASGSGSVAIFLLKFHLKDEAERTLFSDSLVCLWKQTLVTFLRGLWNILFWSHLISAMPPQKKNYMQSWRKFTWRCEMSFGEARSHVPSLKNVFAVVSTEPDDSFQT